MARKITFIVARAINGCIGRDNYMPWALSEDLKRFKRLTMNTPMIMGRKTFDSLPGLLPRRRHIVITRDQKWQAKGVEVAHSVKQALAMAGDGDISVIGGAEIFKLMAEHATHLEITEVYENTLGDIYMATPSRDWVQVSRRKYAAEGDTPAFAFVTLERAKNAGSGA